MKKKDLLYAYLLEIPIVIILLFWHFSVGFWIVMITLLVILPLSTLRKPIIQIPDVLNNMPATNLMLAYLCFITLVSLGYFVGHDSYIEIATTDNIKKASDIENMMSAHYYNTIRFVDGNKYIIALRNANKQAYKEAVLHLIYSDIITDDVGINLNTPDTLLSLSYEKLVTKRIKHTSKELQYLLNGIDGVYSSDVQLKLNECSMFDELCKPINVAIKIDTSESFDTEEIKSLAEKLLLSSVAGLTKDDISIDFNIQPCSSQDKCYNYQTTRRLYRKAKDYYKQKDYTHTLKYLEQANKIDPAYSVSIENVKKIQELDKAISKAPYNYKLYIQRADLKNLPEYAMFIANRQGITSDYYSAIEDYTKALELNPKAYEVYEKRGDAWSECGYQACEGCKLERTAIEDENVIKDYEQAIKYTGGNDILFEKLGDRYSTTDPNKALEYYNMISNQYPKHEYKYLPMPDNAFSAKRTYGYLPLKKAYRYADTGDYDSVFTVFDKVLSYETDKTIIQEVHNMQFYYNWKTGHYKEALKGADDCSVWVCKVLGLIF